MYLILKDLHIKQFQNSHINHTKTIFQNNFSFFIHLFTKKLKVSTSYITNDACKCCYLYKSYAS